MTGVARDKKIGDMNGWMSTLFRVQLVVTPIVFAAILTLGTWLVQSVNLLTRVQAVLTANLERLAHDHYTRDAARADQLLLRKEILEDVAKQYPPPYLLEQVQRMDKRIERLESNEQL